MKLPDKNEVYVIEGRVEVGDLAPEDVVHVLKEVSSADLHEALVVSQMVVSERAARVAAVAQAEIARRSQRAMRCLTYQTTAISAAGALFGGAMGFILGKFFGS